MRRGAGFTLIEILISMTIALIAVGAALAILSAQSAGFTRQSGLGSAIAQGHTAMSAIERALRLAGTGIDPQMAFDFDFYACGFPGAATTAMNESANCAAKKRDAKDQADELVVAYRDPAYSVANPVADARTGCAAANAGAYVGKVWGVTAASATSVSLVLKPGDTIYRGQVLLIGCSDGVSYTYATVNNPRASVPPTAAACTTTVLSLYANSTRDPYNQPGYLSTACFSSGTARAYAVRRQRFFVYRDLTGANPTPYLMLDQGLDLNDDGALTDLDLLPLASDVEDLQVAYATEQPGILSLSTAPTGWTTATYVKDSNANGVWGDDPAAAAAEQLTEPVFTGAGNVPTAQFDAANAALFAGAGQRCTASASNPFFQYPCILGTSPVEVSQANNIHAYRWTAWPGNITQVLVGLVARGPVAELSQAGSDDLRIPLLLDRPAQESGAYGPWYAAMIPAGRKRIVLFSGVRPVNMSITRLFWN